MQIRLRNTGQLITEQEFRALHPNTLWPDDLSILDLGTFDADFVFQASRPAHNELTHTLVETDPQFTNGQWVQQWEVVALDSATAAANEAAIVAKKIDDLWSAANAYTTNYISGLAIGILTIGVIQSKPKALAVKTWSDNLWAEYFNRKAAVTATSVLNLDFSNFGPMPYSVPELQAEIGL